MKYSIGTIFQIVALLGCASSCIYYILCLWCANAFRRSREDNSQPSATSLPPVSILKPLKGIDPEIYESFRSHCLQDYPDYEIIFGVSDPADPAVASVETLRSEFPERAIRLVVCPEQLGANVKISNLEQMVRVARYEHLVVNDSDIRVEPDYLKNVTPPLLNEQIGMVTCLYRGVPANTLGSRLEALGISTDFSAGVLIAERLEGGLHFGLGSTLALRRRDLERIGGFRALVDYLADDYELGRRISALGTKVILSSKVVETYLPAYDFRGFLAHQTRWARGVRDARLGGYIGLIFTFGWMWAILNLLTAHAAAWSWVVLAAVSVLRIAMAVSVGRGVLRDGFVLRNLWLLPVRDLIAVWVWIVSFMAHTVEWRGEKFVLKRGRLIHF